MRDASTTNAQTTDEAFRGALAGVYGEGAAAQVRRYREALNRFKQMYGPGPVSLYRAPGRINLVGGHTDYNHGYVLPVALDRDLVLLARPRTDRQVRLANIEAEFHQESFAISDAIPSSQAASWTNYVRGAAQTIANLAPVPAYAGMTGMDCLVVGRAPYGVPRGSGLSSSSALTVAAALTLAEFAGMAVDRQAFVQVCSDAEWYVGTRGGIMDQFISLFARQNHALFLDCRPDSSGRYRTRLVPLPEQYEFIVAESGVRHNNVRGEYNKRVAACRTGAHILRSDFPQVTHLRDVEDVDWALLEPRLPAELTVAAARASGSDIGDVPGLKDEDCLRVQACCRHVWHENRRVRDVYRTFIPASAGTGDIALAGRLISAAHASARDDYQISFPEMETLVASASHVPGVAGGRITGAGWGGCAVFLVQRDSVPALKARLEEDFRARHGSTPAIYPCRSGAAAGRIATVHV